MATIWTHRDSNIRKTWLLITGFLIFVSTVGWVFSQVYGNPAIFLFAFVFSILMSVFSYWFSDKIVIATTGAKLLPDEVAPEVHNIIENLAITAGILKMMNKTELEGVLAHEMSHIGNRDMLVSTVVVVLVGVIQLLSDIFLRSMRWGFRGNNRDSGQAGAIFLLIGIA